MLCIGRPRRNRVWVKRPFTEAFSLLNKTGEPFLQGRWGEINSERYNYVAEHKYKCPYPDVPLAVCVLVLVCYRKVCMLEGFTAVIAGGAVLYDVLTPVLITMLFRSHLRHPCRSHIRGLWWWENRTLIMVLCATTTGCTHYYFWGTSSLPGIVSSSSQFASSEYSSSSGATPGLRNRRGSCSKISLDKSLNLSS